MCFTLYSSDDGAYCRPIGGYDDLELFIRSLAGLNARHERY